jgi:ABC-2 type transport system permease protein
VLALALTFPVVLTAMYLGDPDPGVIFAGYLGSALLAGSYLSLGMFTSALTKNQVISFIVAVVLGLFLILAGFPPVTDILANFLPATVVDGIAAFSFMSHYDALQRGVIDLRDLVYFASVMGFMLFATHVVLQYKAAA